MRREEKYILRVWEELIDLGLVNAAAGMLDDLFIHHEANEQFSAEAGGAADTGSRLDASKVRASIRELLMTILGDDDGREFEAWRTSHLAADGSFHDDAWDHASDCAAKPADGE
jgi:hypothetical protein